MKISNNITLNGFISNINKSTTLGFQKNKYITFKGNNKETQDIFLKEDNNSQKIITTEQIQKSGEKFLNDTKKDNSVEKVEIAYQNYYKTISDYCKQNNLGILEHEWVNSVNDFRHCVLDRAKKENANVIELNEVKKVVKKTNELISVHQLFSGNGTEKGDLVKMFDVQTVFNTALKLAKENAREKNINIIVQNEKLLNEINQGTNQFKNYTIFSNILGNAIKYSPEGSNIKIKFAEQKTEYIKQDGTHSGQLKMNYYFIVEDKGIGIPEKDQKSVLEGNRSSNVGDIYGTGQGLLEVADASNKKINITSPLYPNEPKYKGTRIEVNLRGWKEN